VSKILASYLFLCAALFAAWQCLAQVPATHAGLGTPAVSGGPYTGPGDVATFTWWCGFRAYSAATTGTKAIRVIRASDSTQQDINTLSSGALDESTLSTFLSATTGKVVTCYDKVGTNDVTTATDANRPAILQNAVGSHTCASSSGGSTQLTSGSTVTQNQPFSVSAYAYRTSGVALGQEVVALVNSGFSTGGAFEFNSTAATVDLYAGASLTASITENVFHAYQNVFNGASSSITVDSTTTNGSSGTQNISGNNINLFNNVGGSQVMFGRLCEAGLAAGAFSGGTISSLATNQASYW
jgi:hypothetical protein